MKGNTKLIGFGIQPRRDGSKLNDEIIVLGRWEKKVSVILPKESVDSIRKACSEDLPIKPPERRQRPGSFAEFLGDTGFVHATLEPDVALKVGKTLVALTGEENSELRQLGDKLVDAHADYVAYNDPKGEPGVPP
jgi:hypothetical protein